MKFFLILIAVSITNPNDIPASLVIEMPNQQQCEASLASMKYQIKFTSFKVIGKCEAK